MTITIEHHHVKQGDPVVRPAIQLSPLVAPFTLEPPNSLVLAPYAFAFLQPESRISSIVSALEWDVLIAHCKTTRRSTIFLRGPGQILSDAYKDHLKFLRAGRSNLSIEILLFTSDGGDLRAIEPNFHRLGAPHHLSFTFRYEKTGEAKAVGLEREGRVILYYPTRLIPSFIPLSDLFTMAFKSLLGVEGAAMTQSEGGTCTKMWCQYDGLKKADRLPILSEAARDGVKRLVSQMAKPAHSKSRVKETFLNADAFARKEKADWEARERGDRTEEDEVVAMAKLLYLLGAFCTVCGGRQHLLQCSGCKIDYYCGKAHQKEDWPHHRSWCKKNPKSPVTSA